MPKTPKKSLMNPYAAKQKRYYRRYLEKTLSVITKGFLYSLLPIGLLVAIANPVVLPIALNKLAINFTVNLVTIYSAALPSLIAASTLYAAGFFGFIARFIGLKKPLNKFKQSNADSSANNSQSDINNSNHTTSQKSDVDNTVINPCLTLSQEKLDSIKYYLDSVISIPEEDRVPLPSP